MSSDSEDEFEPMAELEELASSTDEESDDMEVHAHRSTTGTALSRVDKLLDNGLIDEDEAEVMKASIRRKAAAKSKKSKPKKEKTAADVDRLLAKGLIDEEEAAIMKASIKRKASAKPKKEKTAADVDRMFKAGLIDEDEAELMKASIRRKASAKPKKPKTKKEKTAADVDRLLKNGLIDEEEADLMKSSIRRKASAKPKKKKEKTAADVDRLLRDGLIDEEEADLMKSSIRRKAARRPVKKFSSPPKRSMLAGVVSSYNNDVKLGYIKTGHTGASYGFRLGACHGFSGLPEPGMCVQVRLTTVKCKAGTKKVCEKVIIDTKREDLRQARNIIFEASGGMVDLSLDEAARIDSVTRVVEDINRHRMSEDKRRRKQVREKMKVLRKASSAQVVFLMDCTGSMGSYIAEAKVGIESVKDKVLEVVQPGATLEFAFVGYRDYGDTLRHQVFGFSGDTEEFSDFLSACKATGGGDQCEDVYGGLCKVSELSWNKNVGTKLFFHIADAPCHGKFFAGSQTFGDSYDGEDPTGTNTQVVLKKLCCEIGAQYVFCQLNASTGPMIKKYNELLQASGGPQPPHIDTFPLANARDMIALVSKTTSDSIRSASLTASASFAGGGKASEYRARLRSTVASHMTGSSSV